MLFFPLLCHFNQTGFYELVHATVCTMQFNNSNQNLGMMTKYMMTFTWGLGMKASYSQNPRKSDTTDHQNMTMLTVPHWVPNQS